MDLAGWQVLLSSLIFWPSGGKGVCLNSSSFAPLYQLLVRQVGQLDRPDPEATQYH